MKKCFLITIFLSLVLAGFSQNVFVAAYDTNAASLGRAFMKLRLRPTYVQHPIVALNDSTYSFDSSRYYIQSFALNGSSDSIVLTLLDGTRFPVVSGGGGSGWLLTGNAGTTAGTNFIGTTDDEPFMGKVNNRQAFYLDSNATGGSTFFGFGAGLNNGDVTSTGVGFKALFTATASSLQNTAFGNKALTLTTGAFNTGGGYLALAVNTTGTNNTAWGHTSMSNWTGSNGTGIGFSALRNGSGSANTALGREAMGSGTVSGVQNTALGYRSGFINSSGARNIYLGNQAGSFNTTGSDQLFISSYTSPQSQGADQNNSLVYGQMNYLNVVSQKFTVNGKEGINTIAPTAYLHINGRETVDAGTAPIKLPAPTVSLTTTGASGSGSAATITFADQTTPPFVVGSKITIAGVTPAGYNETDIVTACTPTSVSYANTTTGSQTVAGTVSQGAPMTTPEAYTITHDGTHIYYTDGTGTRKQLD